MTPRDFVVWLRGFTEGVHHYNVTPAQWDQLKEQLTQVQINETNNSYQHFAIEHGQHKTVNTTSNVKSLLTDSNVF